MKDQNALQALEQGFVTRPGDVQDRATLIAAVATTNGPSQVTQIGKPVDFSNINMQGLVDNNDNVIEFDFDNQTGAAQIVYLSALFGLPGEHEGFGLQASAVDFASFLETTTMYQANAGQVKGFNSRAKTMPVIIKSFTIQTSNLAQSNQKLIVGFTTKTLTKMESSKIPSLCDACYNNNDNAFTKEFVGPFGVGQSNYIGYKVLAGQTVMVRIELVGEGKVTQFVAE